MRKQVCALCVVFILIAGCSRTWVASEISAFRNQESPDPARCGLCHAEEYETWKKTAHATSSRLTAKPGLVQGCAVCHDNAAHHLEDPSAATPSSIPSLGAGEKNILCGSCHFNKSIVDRKAINPHDRHGLFMDVGFASESRQIDCLQCHRGHGGKADMLKSIRAHTCFSCHKEAIVTMGVFQPVNYLAAGKACFGCHTVHGGRSAGKLTRMGVGVAVTCVICHPTLKLDETWF